jgi:hypothetical protein
LELGDIRRTKGQQMEEANMMCVVVGWHFQKSIMEVAIVGSHEEKESEG